MRTITAIVLFLALVASLGAMPQPAQAAVVQPSHSDCCAGMETNHPKNDCGGKAPQSKQDRQCCAACALGLVWYVANSGTLMPPPNGDQRFAAPVLNNRSRSERPPTPPPRTAFA